MKLSEPATLLAVELGGRISEDARGSSLYLFEDWTVLSGVF